VESKSFVATKGFTVLSNDMTCALQDAACLPFPVSKKTEDT